LRRPCSRDFGRRPRRHRPPRRRTRHPHPHPHRPPRPAYRDYPAAARAARQHGRVVTRVTISRAGELLDIRLDRSSGWPLIDNAEMAAIRRAMPLPPVPAGMRGDPIVLVLPMNY